MDTNLLRSWLGLPPGPWPPGERELLGLPPGPVDPAEAERRALERMGKLRAHQLLHPDLVTEGMNRLAQALLAVTTSAAPRAAPPPAPAAPAKRPISLEPTRVDLRPPAVPSREAPPVAEVEPVIVAEPVEAEPAVAPAPTRRRAPAAPPRVKVPVPHLTVRGDPDDRRAAYRELAAVRGVLRAWEKLAAAFGDPAAELADAGEVCDFLEGVLAYRAAVGHPGLSAKFVRQSAPRVAAVLRQPLALAVFRSLGPRQREALARDWATGRAHFQAQMAGLRDALARSAPPRPAVTGAGLRAAALRRPEWMLILPTVLVGLATLVRLLLR